MWPYQFNKEGDKRHRETNNMNITAVVLALE